MILRVLTTSLLLISGAYAATPHHAAAPKPDLSTLTGKAQGGVIKRCTKECETITEDHFVEVYGGICSEDTIEGQRILERIRDHKAQLIMRTKGDPYIEAKDWKRIDNEDEQAKMMARAILDPAKNAAAKKELEAIKTNCDEGNIKLISRVDMLNNSPRLTSKVKPKLNGILAEGEKMAPFSYGMQCVAQCRDPLGATSGRDMTAEQIYVKAGG